MFGARLAAVASLALSAGRRCASSTSAVRSPSSTGRCCRGRAGAMILDHASDPRELKNPAADPARGKTVREMKRLLARLPNG